jgi:hypothetical protein
LAYFDFSFFLLFFVFSNLNIFKFWTFFKPEFSIIWIFLSMNIF